jgi:lipopolysaccharide transport system permease protein
LEQKLYEKVYTPDSQLRDLKRLFRNMWQDLLASRELAWRLFVRNISARFRQSILGYLWAFLPPIITTITFVFLKSQNILDVGDTVIPYPVYVMIGTLLWQGFVDALNSPLLLVNSSKTLLAKINFPRESLLLTGLYEVLFNFIIRLILLIFVFIWFHIQIPITALLAPFGIIALMALGLMIGILLTPLGFLFQDISRGTAVLVSFWFFVTPVIYPPPTTWPASLISQINPVSPLLITTRELMTTGRIILPGASILVAGATLFLMFGGWIIYRVAMRHLIERIGA